MKVGERVHFDDVNDHCFGCGSENPNGLRLQFAYAGGQCVEARYVAAAHLCGAPNVVHGGIQATLLDEACGFACRTVFPNDPGLTIVTAEFSLRYRRPVPTGVPLTLRGEVMRQEGRNIFIEASILDAEGESLTTSDARWVKLEPATSQRVDGPHGGPA